MKSYRCTFVKMNGEERKIHFVYLKNVPENYLYGFGLLKKDTKNNAEEKKEKQLSEGMKYVLDLEKNQIRIINEKTIIGQIEEIEINDQTFNI